MPDESNGRVTIAVLGNKLDSLISAQLQTNAKVEEIRRTQNGMCQDLAVNRERWQHEHERWIAHQGIHDDHNELHKRERGVFGTLIFVANAVSGSIAAWWGSR